MTFFSDHKLQHLSKQLQNNKVEELLGQITSLVQSRLPRHDTASAKPLQLAIETRGIVLGAGEATYYLEGEYWYFQSFVVFLCARVSPIYVFSEDVDTRPLTCSIFYSGSPPLSIPRQESFRGCPVGSDLPARAPSQQGVVSPV